MEEELMPSVPPAEPRDYCVYMAYVYGYNPRHEWLQLFAKYPIPKNMHKRSRSAIMAYKSEVIAAYQFELKHAISWNCAAGCGRPAHELLHTSGYHIDGRNDPSIIDSVHALCRSSSRPCMEAIQTNQSMLAGNGLMNRHEHPEWIYSDEPSPWPSTASCGRCHEVKEELDEGLKRCSRITDWERHKDQCKRIIKVVFEPTWSNERLKAQWDTRVEDLAAGAKELREGRFLEKRGGWTEEEKKQRAAQGKK